MLEKNGRKKSAVYGVGGRQNYDAYQMKKLEECLWWSFKNCRC